MNLGPHAVFIVAAYGVSIAVVGALVIWISADYSRQKRRIADLEVRGITRRSARPR